MKEQKCEICLKKIKTELKKMGRTSQTGTKNTKSMLLSKEGICFHNKWICNSCYQLCWEGIRLERCLLYEQNKQ